MGKLIDLTNQKFEKLLVLYRDKDYEKNHTGTFWHCKCDCGNEITISSAHLRNGHTKSCGCLRTEVLSKKSELTKLKKEQKIQEHK